MSSKVVWKFPWGYAESFAIAAGFTLAGAGIQFFSGTHIPLLVFPYNAAALIAFIIALFCLQRFGHRNSLIQWLSSIPAALSAMVLFTVLSLLMGFVTQSEMAAANDIASNVKHSWMYLFAQIYILTSLGLTIFRRFSVKLKNIGFTINHAGLWIVLAAASFGAGDIQRFTMRVNEGAIEWIGTDRYGNMVELPVAIMLHDFNVDFYPPEIGIWNSTKEQLLKTPSFSLLKPDTVFQWESYNFRINTLLKYAWLMGDTFRSAPAPGSVYAAEVTVWPSGSDSIKGWICQNSALQNAMSLPFSDDLELVLKPSKPKFFQSQVTIYTKNGSVSDETIMVNQPVDVDGWTVYQFSYDEAMGEWGTSSVFELVKDPWLPVIYIGLAFLIAGSVFMFLSGVKPRKKANDLR